MEERKLFAWQTKAVSRVRKVPLLNYATECRCLHTSEDLLKQLLDKLKKAQLFGI